MIFGFNTSGGRALVSSKLPEVYQCTMDVIYHEWSYCTSWMGRPKWVSDFGTQTLDKTWLPSPWSLGVRDLGDECLQNTSTTIAVADYDLKSYIFFFGHEFRADFHLCYIIILFNPPILEITWTDEKGLHSQRRATTDFKLVHGHRRVGALSGQILVSWEAWCLFPRVASQIIWGVSDAFMYIRYIYIIIEIDSQPNMLFCCSVSKPTHEYWQDCNRKIFRPTSH
jgi:hypothetical protein